MHHLGPVHKSGQRCALPENGISGQRFVRVEVRSGGKHVKFSLLTLLCGSALVAADAIFGAHSSLVGAGRGVRPYPPGGQRSTYVGGGGVRPYQ